MSKWRFEQLGGSKKVLELDGYAAPFGRNRKAPVIKEILKSRVQTTKYPGKSGAPTRSTFGVDWEPMELTGRWMSKFLPGDTGANEIANAWSDFMKDEQTFRMSWGSIVSYIGFMESLELGREDPDNIAWKMNILCDQREGVHEKHVSATAKKTIADNYSDLIKFVARSQRGLDQIKGDFEPTFFEKLAAIASKFNEVSRDFNNIVSQIDQIESASYAAIQSFRSGVTGIQRSITDIRDIVTNTIIDSAIVGRSAVSDVKWFNYQLSNDSETYQILATLADMDRQAEIAAMGQSSAVVTAQQGDTWETIATRAGRGPEGANDVRKANSITYGEQPVVGRQYVVL